MQPPPPLREGLEEAGRRITAIGLVHRRLYRGNQVEMVDAARYVEELCTDTFSFMGHGLEAASFVEFGTRPVAY